METTCRMYWLSTGYRQTELDELYAAEDEGIFEFSQEAQKLFHSYYRLHNDGDIPMWMRRNPEQFMHFAYDPCLGSYRHLPSDAGYLEFELRISEMVVKQFRRYLREQGR